MCLGGWRVGSVLRACAVHAQFGSEHPHQTAQKHLSPVPGGLMSLYATGTHTPPN